MPGFLLCLISESFLGLNENIFRFERSQKWSEFTPKKAFVSTPRMDMKFSLSIRRTSKLAKSLMRSSFLFQTELHGNQRSV